MQNTTPTDNAGLSDLRLYTTRSHPDPETRRGLLEVRVVGQPDYLQLLTAYASPDGSEAAAQVARVVECVNACAGMADPAAEIAALRQALAHALAFVEHTCAHFDDPVQKIDSFKSAVDDGPEMECNLRMMRDALKGATK